MSIAGKLLEDLKNIVNPQVMDSMEDETGLNEVEETKALTEDYEEDDELGLYIQTDGALYHKYIEKGLEKGTPIAWDKLVAEGAKKYIREISKNDPDAPQKFSAEELQSAKEYIQDYYASELTPEQREATGRNYQALTVKSKTNEAIDYAYYQVYSKSFDNGEKILSAKNRDFKDAEKAVTFAEDLVKQGYMDITIYGASIEDENKLFPLKYIKDGVVLFDDINPDFAKKDEDFKPAKMKKAEYKDMKIKKPEEEKASIKEEVAEKLSFKIGDADCTATNSTSDDITAEDVKQAIEAKNPPIFFNDADSYHYIMDFSFDKNGKKYWIESKNIEGDFSKMDFNIYESAPVKESVAGKLLKQCEDLKIEIEVKDDGEIEVEIKPEDAEIVDIETEEKESDAIEEEPVEDTIEPAAVSNEPDFDEDFEPAKMQKAKYNKTQVVKPQEDENGKKAEQSLKEEEEDDELDAEQQEELKNAKDLYKKHGMLFLDDEDGKNAYDVLYNAGYTMKKDGDVAHCIELNKLRESRADKVRKGAYKRFKHESLNEDKYSDVEALIEEIFGKVGTEPGDFRLYSDIATAFVTKNRQGGGITGAIVRGKNLKELTLKLEAIKDYIAYQKHPEYFNEAWSDAELAQVGAIKEKPTKKYKIYQNGGGEIAVTTHILNDNWALMDESDDFDTIDDKMISDWLEANWTLYDKELLNDDAAKAYHPISTYIDDDEHDLEYYHIYDLSKYYADKNESMNEVKPEDVEEVKVQRQLNSLKAALKANATGDEEDIKKAVDAADKADKNIKLTKKWKKAKGIVENKKPKKTSKKSLTESTVVASYDNGKHEIVKCDKGYFNKYNITEGKARFTTKCVKNLPTAIGALKKRFPEAEEDK